MRGTIFRRLAAGAKKLLRDQRGNTMILTAAACVPVVGIVGSGIDIGRAYMAQLRLQQACDAGALAARRYMGAGAYGGEAEAEAQKMFNFNFPQGLYGSQSVTFQAEPQGFSDVQGTATARLPALIMHIFGYQNFNLSVNCSAKLEISNTDVMLVLDVTGSMEGSRLRALKNAARVFLSTLLEAEVGDGRIRVGVVPYSGAVNVGGILHDANPSWIANTVTVPSREWDASRSRYNLLNRTFDVTDISPGDELSFNTGYRGAQARFAWNGCVMERKTTSFNQNTTAPSDAYDMDINMVPTSNDDTKWRVFLSHYAYSRSGTGTSTTTSNNNSFGQNADDRDVDLGACPASVMKLTLMDDEGQEEFDDKIEELWAQGFTYHDSGMVWGARLISPTGLFAGENATAENKRPIARHIIFMTDGDMNTPRSNFSHQGQEQSVPRIGATSDNNAIARHNNRFVQICNRAKNQNIVVWVIGFGGDIKKNDTLNDCATPGLAYQAGTDKELEAIFASIAGQISRLRLSQ